MKLQPQLTENELVETRRGQNSCWASNWQAEALPHFE
jgi:hypothetical protein